MKKTVVLLLSDKRSGSTMVQSELCKHPDIRHVDYSPHTYHETHHWLKAAVMLDYPADRFSGEKVYSGYGSRENARAYMIDCLRGNLPELTIPKDDRDIVFQGWGALCKQFAQPVFFEKSPQYIAHPVALDLLLEWIEKTEFSVKIIGLVRNPLAVQYSAQRLFHSQPEKRQFGWMEAQTNLLAFADKLPAGAYLQVRYEDIISDPTEKLGEVCDFIGVSRDPGVGGGVHGSSVEKWREDPTFRFSLDPSVSAFAASLGYSGEDLHNCTVSSGVSETSISVFKKLALARNRFRDRVVRPLRLRRQQSRRKPH